MKTAGFVFLVTLLIVTPALAQQDQPEIQETHGYFTAVAGLAWFSNVAGFSTAGNQATSDVGVDIGVRVHRHLLIFGDGGWLRNLQQGIQPMLVGTTTSLYNTHAISLTGGGSLGVWYGLGGLGAVGPTLGRWTPYARGGIGIARLEPALHFTYHSGTIPGRTTAPATGADVTNALTSAGYFKAPSSSTERMVMVSGGVQLVLSPRVVADGQYRYWQIAADSVLTSKAINTSAITFGLGVRF
jgi:opacity protein-like surface antigen